MSEAKRYRLEFKAVKAWFYASAVVGLVGSLPFALPLLLNGDASVYGRGGAPLAAVLILLSAVLVLSLIHI